MHRLLKRQLKRVYGEDRELNDFSAKQQKFVEIVDNTYVENDRERKLLEHVLELSSQELKCKNQEIQDTLLTLAETNKMLEQERETLLEKVEERTRELNNALLEAENTSQAKTQFLANMSHEIRTPMNGVLGMTRLVLDMELGAKQTKLLTNVMFSAESLLGILNDILDFSKIEAGQLSLILSDCILPVMIDNIISTLGLQAEDKGILLKNTTDSKNIPHCVKADELRLRQVLVNLVGNAIKFTREGEVAINITEQEAVAEGKVALLFSVRDTGIGICQEKQKTIFDSFTQADDSTARVFGGTGLGLAISKTLVSMMGGELCVESSGGQGSEFSFVIEVEKGSADSQLLLKPELACSGINNLNILLVDDNKINQDLAQIILEKDGQHVEIAEDGLSALEILLEKDFDIVLMDIQMPLMDGLTATKIIRNCEKGKTGNSRVAKDLEAKLIARLAGKHNSIISMTANVMESDRQRCKQAGMDDFLSKPFMPHDLHTILNRFSNSEEFRLSTPSEAILRVESPSVESLYQKSYKYLQEIYKLDDNTVRKLLTKAATTLTVNIGSLESALSNNNVEKLQQSAHSLKGALLNLGLMKLADKAKAIEQISLPIDSATQQMILAFIQQLTTSDLFQDSGLTED